MTAHQIGYLAGLVIILIAVPAVLLAVGYRRTRNLEPEVARRHFRPYRVAAWVFGIAVAIAAGLTVGGVFDTEPSVDEIMAGVDSGCWSSCVAQRTLTASECEAYCTCMSEPLRQRLAEDPAFREVMVNGDPTAIVDMVVQDFADEIQACLPTLN